MQTTLPGLEQETLPLEQLPEDEPVPEGAAGYEGAAEEAAGADGAALDDAAIELEAAPLVMVCMVVTVTAAPPWPP